MLTEREEALTALIQFGLTLTRIEQHTRQDRDVFLEYIVSRSQNDGTVIIMKEDAAIVDAVDG